MTASTNDTDVLAALRNGTRGSLDRIVPMVYEELRRIARRQLARRNRPGARDPTLATTALVNEAYLKLVDQSQADWKDRAHFLALAAVSMRHILIDRAKARIRRKRGGGVADVTLEDAALVSDGGADRLLEIDDALDRLATISPRLAQVVVCRFYGGLSQAEIAEALSVTVRTVERDWAKARLLLRRSLAE